LSNKAALLLTAGDLLQGIGEKELERREEKELEGK
jgi:hypothetical protein